MKEHVLVDGQGRTWNLQLRKLTGAEAEGLDSPWVLVAEGEEGEPARVGIGADEAAGFDGWTQEDQIRFLGMALEEKGVRPDDLEAPPRRHGAGA